MGKRKAVAIQPILKDKLVHADTRQVAGDETINVEEMPQSRQGDDVEAALEFGDLFNRRGNRALGMKFAQELLGYSSQVVVREVADAEFNQSAPFGSVPRVGRVSPV